MFNTAADVGAFAGPLLDAALLLVDFRLASAVATGVGSLLDSGATGRTVVSLALLGLGLAGAGGTALLQRRGLLDARDEAAG